MCTVCACFVYCLRLLPNKWQTMQIVFLFLSIFSASHWQSEIHGDHMLSGTSLTMIIYIAGLSHLLTRHLSTVIKCTVLRAAWRGGRELSQHQQPVVHCAGRSRGAWMQGTAVGSWREEELKIPKRICNYLTMTDQLLGSTLYKLTECQVVIFARIMNHLQQLWNGFCVCLWLKLKSIFYLQIQMTASMQWWGWIFTVFELASGQETST